LAWTVSFEPRALSELNKLDRPARLRIVRFFQERIAETTTHETLANL